MVKLKCLVCYYEMYIVSFVSQGSFDVFKCLFSTGVDELFKPVDASDRAESR